MRLASVLALSFVCYASLAHADALPRLTDRGRLIPSGSLGGYVASNSGAGLYDYADAAAWLEPSLVYFVRDRVGIGAYAGYEFSTRDVPREKNTGHGIGAGVTAMAELPLSPKLGLLWIIRVGYLQRFTHRESSSSFDPSSQDQYDSDDSLRGQLAQIVVEGSLPVLIHASSSVAFGFGPTLRWAPYVLASNDYPAANQFRPLRLGASSWIGVSF